MTNGKGIPMPKKGENNYRANYEELRNNKFVNMEKEMQCPHRGRMCCFIESI